MNPQIIRGALIYSGGFAVDADGSPEAYAPPPLVGLDHLANAGHVGNWWGLACDRFGIPYIQGPHDPKLGYYVSTTALVDHSKSVNDPARYVNSSTVPYVSIARDLLRRCSIHPGDLAMVCCRGKMCGAIVADVGPAGKYGEGSVALAEALGIPSNPRSGGCSSGVTWLVFPGSSGGWPRQTEVGQQAGVLFANWGGQQGLDLLPES